MWFMGKTYDIQPFMDSHIGYRSSFAISDWLCFSSNLYKAKDEETN